MNSLGSLQPIFYSIFLLIGFIFLLTTIYIFPMMSHYRMKTIDIVKNSFFFSLRFFSTTFLSLLCITATGMILYFWQITFLFIYCVCAFCISFLCNRVFQKVQEQVKTLWCNIIKKPGTTLFGMYSVRLIVFLDTIFIILLFLQIFQIFYCFS